MIDRKIDNKYEFLWPEFSCLLKRFGPEEDGGYVIPTSSLKELRSVISFGVNVDWRFERHIQKETGSTIHCYDSNDVKFLLCRFVAGGCYKLITRKISLTDFLSRAHRLADYFIFFRGATAKISRLYINTATARQIFSQMTSNTLLKCDIESSEYEILDLVCEYKEKFDVVVIEFHEADRHLMVLSEFFETMRETFAVVHLHLNNFETPNTQGTPKIFEITFVRRTMVIPTGSAPTTLPQPLLDYPSVSCSEDIRLTNIVEW